MMGRRAATAVAVLLLAASVCHIAESENQHKGNKMQITTSAFGKGQKIPKQYTGEGEDISPPLAWSGVPDGARELALLVDDPDAPRPEPWVHWVAWKIPASATGLLEGAGAPAGKGVPAGMFEGKNDFGNVGYGGPMPPPRHGPHHYHFQLFALSAPLDLKEGATKKDLLAAVKGKTLAKAELIGTYERK